MTPIEQAIVDYVQGRVMRGEIATTTAEHFRIRLRSLAKSFGEQPLCTLDRHAVEQWQESIGHLSPASRKAFLSTTRTFCEWLLLEQLVTVNPCAGLPKVRNARRVPRALPSAAVAKLLAVCATKREQLIVLMLVVLGLRRGELARLQTGDYDPLARTLFVCGKGGHERMLPVPCEVADALDSYLDAARRTAGPLIRSDRYRNRGISPETLGILVSNLMRRAGVKRAAFDGRSAHSLRHTCLSDVLENSHDLRAVQQLAGHTSLATTEIYLRTADLGRLRQAMSGRHYL